MKQEKNTVSTQVVGNIKVTTQTMMPPWYGFKTDGYEVVNVGGVFVTLEFAK